MRLEFTHTSATGPCHCCHSLVQVAQDSRPYLIVSFENGFPFRRLLRLAGLRWCSNPTPHGMESSAALSKEYSAGERATGTQCIGGLADPRAGLDDVDK
jgi:hypothetical protein